MLSNREFLRKDCFYNIYDITVLTLSVKISCTVVPEYNITYFLFCSKFGCLVCSLYTMLTMPKIFRDPYTKRGTVD